MWKFNGKEFDEELIGKNEGFIYLITNNTTGQKYIGRKYFWSLRKSRKKADIGKKRKRAYSDWKEYWSSSDILKEDVEKLGKDNFTREILMICKTRGDTNRMETAYLWQHNVLERDDFYNETIGNFRKSTKDIMEARIISENGKKMLNEHTKKI